MTLLLRNVFLCGADAVDTNGGGGGGGSARFGGRANKLFAIDGGITLVCSVMVEEFLYERFNELPGRERAGDRITVMSTYYISKKKHSLTLAYLKMCNNT